MRIDSIYNMGCTQKISVKESQACTEYQEVANWTRNIARNNDSRDFEFKSEIFRIHILFLDVKQYSAVHGLNLTEDRRNSQKTWWEKQSSQDYIFLN